MRAPPPPTRDQTFQTTTINAEGAARLSRNQIDGSLALGGGPDGPPQKSSRLAKILTVSSAELAENSPGIFLCGLCGLRV